MKELIKKISIACKKLFDAFCNHIKNIKLTPKTFLIKLSIFILTAAVLFGVSIIAVSSAIVSSTQTLVRENLPEDENYECIVVLGAKVHGNSPSHMLEDRLKTAIELYFAGVAPILLMSGDGESPDTYDEVRVMKEYAISVGVPEKDIVCDPYGLSTYDSIVRAIEVYGYESFCIVTQEYHLSRALYIASKLDADCVGVSASIRTYRGQFARDVREILARFKDFFYVLLEKEATYTE